jgi:hypothetical protein
MRRPRQGIRASSRVEAGSNTSTVTVRVVGGDEKGNLKSETVKYGRESLRPNKDCAGKGQQHIQNTDPSSRQSQCDLHLTQAVVS